MNDEHLDLLRRIAKDVADIKAALAASVAASAAALGVQASSGASGGGGVATAAEMDSEYGDPLVKKDPGRWTGESFVGCHFSQTTPEYLDCMADLKDWMADKDDKTGAKDGRGRPRSHWSRKDARLCRGWAARLRAGWKPKTNGATAPQEEFDDADGDEVPF
ncbi:MAG TPA: hypothetical protein VFP90_04870 [Gemmatimonadaceae bacterium]|nr:hypothetical protein [Gemmatimonadaceae bacterium]